MILFILSYLGGALTILAPCILPILPFVFARLDQPFVKSGLPLLAGMAVTFTAVGTLGAVAGNWAVQANEYGRIVAMLALAAMGLALIAPRIAERVTRPIVGVGSSLSNAASQRSEDGANPAGTSFLLGIATGLVWAPCAGPVLGLVLTGAAIEGPSVRTSLLLLAYAAGAMTSLAIALLAGGKMFVAMKRYVGVGEWFRKSLGFVILAGVTAIALGLDTGLLAQLSLGSGSTTVEKKLIERLSPQRTVQTPLQPLQPAVMDRGAFVAVRADSATVRTLPPLPVLVPMPSLSGAVEWLNSPPLTAEALRGKVVLVDFWTFGCVNCLNALPHVREWHRKYKDQGLVVIGVHSPEFAFEKNVNNVKGAIGRLDISFPVAIDNNFTVWRAFSNNYWPAHYFIDAKGNIRFLHFGEGEYEESEQVIKLLLEEARKESKPV